MPAFPSVSMAFICASLNVASQALLVVDVATGSLRTLGNGIQTRSLAWQGDSALITVPSNNGAIQRFSVNGGAASTLGQTVQDSVEYRLIATADNGALLPSAKED